MRTELPVCTRCCFCFPLRYGLIVWGYLKLIASSVLLVLLAGTMVQALMLFSSFKHRSLLIQGAIFGVIALVIICQIAFTVVFLVGGHKKNIRLLKIFQRYLLVMWILLSAASVFLLGGSVVRMVNNSTHDLIDVWLFLLDSTSILVNLITEAYFLLLLRSEILKLENAGGFKFINNAADSQCTMNVPQKNMEVTATIESVKNNEGKEENVY